jgi:hypothetical protein
MDAGAGQSLPGIQGDAMSQDMYTGADNTDGVRTLFPIRMGWGRTYDADYRPTAPENTGLEVNTEGIGPIAEGLILDPKDVSVGVDLVGPISQEQLDLEEAQEAESELIDTESVNGPAAASHPVNADTKTTASVTPLAPSLKTSPKAKAASETSPPQPL